MRSSNSEPVFRSSRKLGGAAKHLIDGGKNAFVGLSFELKRPLVIERRSKMKPRREIKLPSSNEYLCFQTDSRGTWSSRFHSRMAFLVVEILNQRWLIKFPWISGKWPFLLRVPLTYSEWNLSINFLPQSFTHQSQQSIFAKFKGKKVKIIDWNDTGLKFRKVSGLQNKCSKIFVILYLVWGSLTYIPASEKGF